MPKPVRILAVDVGTGTQDILLFESGKTIENCFKMVMPLLRLLLLTALSEQLNVVELSS